MDRNDAQEEAKAKKETEVKCTTKEVMERLDNRARQEKYRRVHHVPCSKAHCPKTTERKFNLGVLNLNETHFIALLSVKYPYPVSNITVFKVQEILSIREYYN
jgi:hypothetical protein